MVPMPIAAIDTPRRGMAGQELTGVAKKVHAAADLP